MRAIAKLVPASVEVEPGSTVVALLRVRNTGTVVERFEFSVIGPTSGWAQIDPPSLSLFPDQAADARITFAPARAPYPPAGTLPFGVRLVPADAPAEATVEEGRVTLLPFQAPSVRVVPQTSHGARIGRHQVVLENGGNAPMPAVVTASDPDQLLTFEIHPDRVTVEAGDRLGVDLRALPLTTFAFGHDRSLPFAIEARPGTGAPLSLRATFVQRAALPRWLLPVAGIALAGVLALVFLPGLIGGRLESAATDAPITLPPSPAPTLATPIPSPGPTVPGPTQVLLRVIQVQSLPPQQRFAWMPLVAITDDLTFVVPGPTTGIDPGPLVPSLRARSMTDRGWAAIVDEARALGLLDGQTDFVPADLEVGKALGRIELFVDGTRHDLIGDPTRLVRCDGARCIPTPGTPEAFAAFWQRLVDPSPWLGEELGREVDYVAEAYAVLVGPPPAEPQPQPQVLVWPLDESLATFGRPIGADPLPRCGIVRGAGADSVRPVLLAATRAAQWVDDASTSTTFGLEVRPLLPGEDACAEFFGI